MSFEIANGVLKKYREEKGVTEVVIPEGVTSIGNGAFSYCHSLTSITINGNTLTLDANEIQAAKETINDAWDMLLNKDFARKFSHKVKFKLILDYFFATENEDAKAYLKKNATKVVKQLIDNGDAPRLQNLLDKTKFVTKRNIDKFIEYAIEKQQQELFVILTNYKNQIGAYKKPEKEFKL